MYLYIDTYFTLNLAADYLILIATARLRGMSVRRLRAAAGAALGAGFAVLQAVSGLGFLRSPLMTLSCAVLMLLACFGGTERLLRTGLVFAGVAAAFGGFALALAQLLGGLRMDMGVLLIAFPACWLVIRLVFSSAAAERPGTAKVVIRHDGGCVSFLAMCDSGNLLRDPVSGDAVLVADAEIISSLFKGEVAEMLLNNAAAEELVELGDARTRFRLIPFGSLGGRGLLPAFRPEEILVDGRKNSGLLVAVSPEKMSDDGSVRAVIGGVR